MKWLYIARCTAERSSDGKEGIYWKFDSDVEAYRTDREEACYSTFYNLTFQVRLPCSPWRVLSSSRA